MKTEAVQTTSGDSDSRTILIVVAVVVILLLLGLVAGGYFGYKYVKKKILGGFQDSGTGAGTVIDIDTGTGDGGTANGLPISDQTSGTEPITRYPGSKMLSHSTMTFAEGGFTYLGYATADSVDEVVAWYKNMLESDGWDFFMETSEAGTETLIYMKEDIGESVSMSISLSSEGYTEISITYTKAA